MDTLTIHDPEAHQLASAIAEQTGETLAKVVTGALRDRWETVRPHQEKATLEELLEIAHRIGGNVQKPYLDHGDLLYDEHGLPR